jgi:hypothetical protein
LALVSQKGEYGTHDHTEQGKEVKSPFAQKLRLEHDKQCQHYQEDNTTACGDLDQIPKGARCAAWDYRSVIDEGPEEQ